MADYITPILGLVLVVSFVLLYLMNVRIKQLERELKDIRSRVAVTDEELLRLTKDIEDFKKLRI
ncbi:MAG TPA: hypothetical protein HA257_05510 [Candidatus Methanoperedenaceae archaeon]|nr:hypothetical protein [Candidatus Methanoperedenaceae archaeon]